MIFAILSIIVMVIVLCTFPIEHSLPVCLVVLLFGLALFCLTSLILSGNIETTFRDDVKIIDIEDVYREKGNTRVCYIDDNYEYHDIRISGTVKLYFNEDITDTNDYFITRHYKWNNRAWYWLGYPLNDIETIYIRSQINE